MVFRLVLQLKSSTSLAFRPSNFTLGLIKLSKMSTDCNSNPNSLRYGNILKGGNSPGYITFSQSVSIKDRDFFMTKMTGRKIQMNPTIGTGEKHSNISFKICSEGTPLEEDEQCLTFLTANSASSYDTNWKRFFDLDLFLQTFDGAEHLIVFTPIVTSTQIVLEQMATLPELNNCPVVVIAGVQTQGVGRKLSRVWESPEGAALFSFNIKVARVSKLGSKLAFVQHFMALAVVRVLKSVAQNYRLQLPKLKIKWPNDIYYDGHKIAGLLVNVKTKDQLMYDVCVGVGLNVDNTSPTICINSIIRDMTVLNPDIEVIESKKEILIAKFVAEFEQIVHEVQNWDQCVFDRYVDEYLDNWMHTNQVIDQLVDGQEKKVTVVGVDQDGFLSVRSQDGAITSVLDTDNIRLNILK